MAFALVLGTAEAAADQAPSPAVEAKQAVKDGARTIGHATRDTTRAIGHGTRDTAKAIGHGTRDAAKAIGHASKDAVTGVGKAASSAWNELTGRRSQAPADGD